MRSASAFDHTATFPPIHEETSPDFSTFARPNDGTARSIAAFGRTVVDSSRAAPCEHLPHATTARRNSAFGRSVHLLCTSAANPVMCTSAVSHVICSSAVNHVICTSAVNNVHCTSAVSHVMKNAARNGAGTLFSFGIVVVAGPVRLRWGWCQNTLSSNCSRAGKLVHRRLFFSCFILSCCEGIRLRQ